MKDKNLSNIDLIEFISKNSIQALEGSRSYRSFAAEVLSLYQPVLNRRFTNCIRFNCSKNRDLVLLSVLSYWMNPIVGFLCRMKVEEILSKRQRSEDLLLLLFGRDICLTFLCTSNRYNDRSLRGLFSEKNLKEFLDRLRIRPEFETNAPVIESVRHKGYRDKGTLANESVRARRQELANELSLKLQQNSVETYHSNIDSFLQMNLNWLKSVKSSVLTENYYFNSKKGVIYYEDDRVITDQDREKRETFRGTSKKRRKSSESNYQLRAENQESEISTQFYF